MKKSQQTSASEQVLAAVLRDLVGVANADALCTCEACRALRELGRVLEARQEPGMPRVLREPAPRPRRGTKNPPGRAPVSSAFWPATIRTGLIASWRGAGRRRSTAPCSLPRC